MPYISTEEVKEIRNAIKKAFPEYRFSVRQSDHSSLYVTVKSGPVDFNLGEGNHQLNQYWYKSHYEDNPELVEFFGKLLEVVNNVKPKCEQHYDSDYGSIPNYYQNFSIGSWNKAYEVKDHSKKAKKTAKKATKPSYTECLEYAFGI
jgi:hypothetical protein